MGPKMPHKLIAGIDEAGRGPLAGPVVAAAVILDPEKPLDGIHDSKKLTARKRNRLYDDIMEQAVAVGIGVSQRVEIDRLNILRATELAMQRAVDQLSTKPDHLQIDGQHIRLKHPSQETVIHGDATLQVIGAASIIAKVYRDRLMADYHRIYPQYGFDRHKGYGTEAHLQALKTYGACPIHRQSFRPVKDHMPTWNQVHGRKELGLLGEQLAAGYLLELGYGLLDLRYTVPHMGELDIIARDDDVTVIVEVKSQTPGDWGSAEERIDVKKRDRLMATAQHYCGEKGIDSEVRFDVISVTFTKAGPQIRHIKSGIHAD